MDKMKPCKCCGEAPVMFRSYRGADIDKEHFNGYFVGCDNYDCPELPMSDVCKTKEAAVKDWNRRMEETNG